MTKKLKKRITRILIGTFFYLLAYGFSYGFSIFLKGGNDDVVKIASLLIFLIAYYIIGGDVVLKALKNIGHGQILDENFLMTIATVGAFFVGEYPEAVAVMLFYQVGEIFQSYAVNKSRKSITDLMDIRPDYANVFREGKSIEVDPGQVLVGETIIVKPGERVPLDGIVAKGFTTLDTRALTGESVPREIMVSEQVISGCVNLSGVIEVVVSKPYGESTVAKILDLVENASNKKAESENFISKFARYYTPFVVVAACLLGIIPPLLFGESLLVWVYRALTFLVISCPCALVISIPLSFFGGLGGSGKIGVLVKGSNYLEALAETEMVVFDKTGTLTKGNFKVVKSVPVGILEEELLEIAAYAEYHSNHPISASLKEAYGKEIEESKIGTLEEIAGQGVCALVHNQIIYAGNTKLMESKKIAYKKEQEAGTVIHVARENQYMGYIVIADEIKEDAKVAIENLYQAGIRKIVMLTGDRKEVAQSVASQLGIKEVYSELLPIDKVDKMEELMKEKSEHGKLLFVGDGINDAPVLARADIGIAMGGLGSDAAIEAADIVIMTDELNKIPVSIKISKNTLRIVKQNIIFALGVKGLILGLAAFGFATMWAAVFADVGVAFIAILNAMRAMNVKKYQ